MSDSDPTYGFCWPSVFTVGLEEAGSSTGQDVSEVENLTQQREETLTGSLAKDEEMLITAQSFRYSRQGSATAETRLHFDVRNKISRYSLQSVARACSL